MNRCKSRRFADRRSHPDPTGRRFGRNSVTRYRTANSNLVVRPSRGVITLGEVAPALKELRARMRARELYSDDLPEAYLRLLCGLTEDTPIDSRVDQLAKENRGAGVFMAEVERARSGDQAL